MHFGNLDSLRGNQASKIGKWWSPNIAEFSLSPSGLFRSIWRTHRCPTSVEESLKSKLCFGVTVVVNYDDLQVIEVLVSVVVCD